MDCATHEWAPFSSPEGGLYRCLKCQAIGSRSMMEEPVGEILVEPCIWLEGETNCALPATIVWERESGDELLCKKHYVEAMQIPSV